MGQGFSKPKQRYSQWGFSAVAGTISLCICVISICSILLNMSNSVFTPNCVFCLLSFVYFSFRQFFPIFEPMTLIYTRIRLYIDIVSS